VSLRRVGRGFFVGKGVIKDSQKGKKDAVMKRRCTWKRKESINLSLLDMNRMSR
jgi:hypothetical protein